MVYILGSDSMPKLIISKARVAPLRRLTLARLELMALLIGARLANNLVLTFSSKQFRVHVWSDSKVALAWLNIPAYNLQTWVANRVEETRDLVPTDSFHHCRGVDNPAGWVSEGPGDTRPSDTRPKIFQATEGLRPLDPSDKRAKMKKNATKGLVWYRAA